MSEVVSMIRNMKAPGSQAKEKPRRKKNRVLVFDGVLEFPELIKRLQSAGLEVMARPTAAASAPVMPDLILAEIHELDEEDRRAVEGLRHAHPPPFVVGIGRPVVVALAKGRRRSQNYPERRRASANRRVFDEFLSTPVDVAELLELLQTWRSAHATRKKSAHRPGSS